MPGVHPTWLDSLARQLDVLGRWVQGRMVITPTPGDDVVPATRFLDLDYLRAAILRAGHVGRDDGLCVDGGPRVDLGPAASRFARHYTAAATVMALAGLARGIGLDVSARHCNYVYRQSVPFYMTLNTPGASVLQCAERPTPWRVDGPTVGTVRELRHHVWTTLYAFNIAPVFAQILEVTNLSQKVLWTNAAEWVAIISESAEEYLGPEEARPFVDDRLALFDLAALPGLRGSNPLADRIEWHELTGPGGHRDIHTRRVCCTTYLLADRDGRLCGSCPFLPPDERSALRRERQGVPLGTPGGPAEQRAIERGRSRMPEHRPASP
jgi:hypothetical protein